MFVEGKESSPKNYEGSANSLLGILFYWNRSFLTVLSTFSLSQKEKTNIVWGRWGNSGVCAKKKKKKKQMKEEKICWAENTEEKIPSTWVYKGKR